jgi:putative spermidine/putrescine transport system substrate-binding protein
MADIDRRHFIRSTGLSAAALAAGSTAWPAPASAQGAITVTHFGGPYGTLKDIVGAPFEQEKLGKVTYETEQPAIILSKLQAQRDSAPWDVVMMVRSFALRAGKAGLLSPLTAKDVPGLGEVQPQAVLAGGHGVAMIIDSLDLMYDSTKVTTPITSWLDLWRPELKGKIVLPAMPIAGFVTFTLLAVARAVGGSEKAVDDAFKKIKELRPSVRAFVTDPNQASQLIERGEILAAPQYSVRISNVMKASAHVARATPKEGVPAAPYDLCVTKGSSQQATAKQYINFVLSRKTQEALAGTLLATPVHRQAKVTGPAQRLVMSDFSKLWFVDEEYVAANQKDWLDRWVREIQS